MRTEAELAWCAALYEGEGTVIYGETHAGPLRVKISSTDHDVLVLMQERSGVGNVYGPHKPNGFGIKPFYEWIVNGHAAARFLTDVRPWLGRRRQERIEEKLALWGGRPQHKMNPEIRAAIRRDRRGGATLKALAAQYGVTFGYVSHICTGRSHPEEIEAERAG